MRSTLNRTENRWRGCGALVLLVSTLTGCHVGSRTVPDDRPLHKVGTVTVMGRTYCLLDEDGDGTPDYVRDSSSGQLLPLRIIRQENMAELTPEGGDAGGIDPAAPWEHEPQIAFDSSGGFDPPEHFDFGDATAEQWIELTGLDVEPGETAMATNIGVNAFDESSGALDAWFLWSGRFGLPSFDDQDVTHAIYAQPGAGPDDPYFLAFHVAGHLADVLPLAAELNVEAIVFEADGSSWEIELNATSATVLRDGRWHADIDF